MKIRRAKISDAKIYWNWFNDSLVRKNSFSRNKISYSQHLSWFKNNLNNDDNYFFFGIVGNQPCAQLRLIFNEKKYTLSYSVDKAFRGKGLGKKILILSLNRFSKFKKFKPIPIIAKVKKKNLPSVKIFENLKFKKIYYNNYFIFKKNLRLNT